MSSVPSISALDSRNFLPASSQVISGWSGSSAPGARLWPGGRQVYCENSAIDLLSGSSCHISGSSIGAPPEGAAGVAPAEGDADGD